MILSGAAIQEAMSKGMIQIEPFTADQLGPAHVDLHLAGDSALIIQARSFVLAKTKETITLGEQICGFMEGRAGLAKQGISVEQSSTFIEPGTASQMTLEIFNASNIVCSLQPGQPIAKMFLMKVVQKL
jgi:deoxycytidine triphosphate deaminase